MIIDLLFLFRDACVYHSISNTACFVAPSGEILKFFDEDKTVTQHSNAIKTIIGEELMLALLVEYFRRAKKYSCEIIDRPCTTGRKKGLRLDAWLKVQDTTTDSNPFLYQIEVKSWSAHGIGRHNTFIDPTWTDRKFEEYKREIWEHYWKSSRFTTDQVNKVLTPMLPHDPSLVIKPLACLWEMMHPDGEKSPFFSVEIENGSPFKEVDVFSVSSFLRGPLFPNETTLTLDLPDLSERLDLLNRIFKS